MIQALCHADSVARALCFQIHPPVHGEDLKQSHQQQLGWLIILPTCKHCSFPQSSFVYLILCRGRWRWRRLGLQAWPLSGLAPTPTPPPSPFPVLLTGMWCKSLSVLSHGYHPFLLMSLSPLPSPPGNPPPCDVTVQAPEKRGSRLVTSGQLAEAQQGFSTRGASWLCPLVVPQTKLPSNPSHPPTTGYIVQSNLERKPEREKHGLFPNCQWMFVRSQAAGQSSRPCWAQTKACEPSPWRGIVCMQSCQCV